MMLGTMHRKWEVNTKYSLLTNEGSVKMGKYTFFNLIFMVSVGSIYHDKRRAISLPSVCPEGFRQGPRPKIFNAYKICTDAVNSP